MGSINLGRLLSSDLPAISQVFNPEALLLTSLTVACLGVAVLLLSRRPAPESVPEGTAGPVGGPVGGLEPAPASVSEESSPLCSPAHAVETAQPQPMASSGSVSTELSPSAEQPPLFPTAEQSNRSSRTENSQPCLGDHGNTQNSDEFRLPTAPSRAPALGASALIADTARLLPTVVTPRPGAEASAARPSRGLAGFQPAGRFSRSQQAFLRIPVVISGRTDSNMEFREETSTVILLPQGAVIHMEQRVRAGDRLTLFSQPRQQEVPCSVFGALRGPDGKILVEIEFVEPQKNFWPVSFPAWAGNGARKSSPCALDPGRTPALDNSRS